MYTRISKVKYAGKTYRYLRIVESIRRKGRVIQRVIANLGDLRLIDKDNLYSLCVSLSKYAGRKPVSIEELESLSSLQWLSDNSWWLSSGDAKKCCKIVAVWYNILDGKIDIPRR